MHHKIRDVCTDKKKVEYLNRLGEQLLHMTAILHKTRVFRYTVCHTKVGQLHVYLKYKLVISSRDTRHIYIYILDRLAKTPLSLRRSEYSIKIDSSIHTIHAFVLIVRIIQLTK